MLSTAHLLLEFIHSANPSLCYGSPNKENSGTHIPSRLAKQVHALHLLPHISTLIDTICHTYHITAILNAPGVHWRRFYLVPVSEPFGLSNGKCGSTESCNVLA